MNESLQKILENSNGWIIKNLKEYGNTVIPNTLVHGKLVHDDLTSLEKSLSLLIKKEIKIRKVKDYSEQTSFTDVGTREYFFIAEVVR